MSSVPAPQPCWLPKSQSISPVTPSNAKSASARIKHEAQLRQLSQARVITGNTLQATERVWVSPRVSALGQGLAGLALRMVLTPK